MAGSRTLKLSILADVDNLKKELDKGSKEVEGFGGKLEKFSAAAKAAFAAAAVAAAGYAVKLAVDGVKAAIEDEAAQKRLANALANVTGATEAQIAAVEEQILKTSLATGVADDQLRPALQRLAVATGDVTKANDLLSLALDISAATGKDVETVSQALGKAYEGNTGALTRLGVGLSAAEIKTMGLEGAITTLSDTFGGAAKTQSETFEGRIQRLQVAFDETKETVGAALLPIVEKLLKFITDTAIPAFEKFKEDAIDPVIQAFKNNETTIRGLFNFFKDNLLPFILGPLVNGIKVIATVASGIVSAVSVALRALEPIINAAITGINLVIRGINLIKPGPDIQPIGKVNFGNSKATGANEVSTSSLPFGISVPTSTGQSLQNLEAAAGGPKGYSNLLGTAISQGKDTSVAGLTALLQSTGTNNFNVGSFRQAENTTTPVVININAPSVIDEDGFARAVTEALNNTQRRTGGGGSQLIL
jgi:hypothetical protein